MLPLGVGGTCLKLPMKDTCGAYQLIGILTFPS